MTASKEELQALLERVEKAEGPDRAIDGHLAVLAGWEWHGDGTIDEHAEFAGHWKQPGFAGNGSFGKRGRGLCDCKTIRPEEGNDLDCPEYTASLDASVALVEKVLPEPSWSISSAGVRLPVLPAARVTYRAEPTQRHFNEAKAATPALALCAALLRALIAKGE